jgi:hypothetical protein
MWLGTNTVPANDDVLLTPDSLAFSVSERAPRREAVVEGVGEVTHQAHDRSQLPGEGVGAAALPDGAVTVKVTVSDNAGNQQSRAWSFTVHTH